MKKIPITTLNDKSGRCVRRLARLAAITLLCGASTAWATLKEFDAAVAADIENSVLAPVASLTTPVTLTGTGGSAFNFGETFDDVTIEFVLRGNPAVGDDSYLAVGQNSVSSLRYEGWLNTVQLGFTQGGVADYFFTPAVPSPTIDTHVVYAWDSLNRTMNVYVNGVLAGTTTGVDENFAMPTGQGWLGARADGAEPMTGTISRVYVYDELVDASVLVAHADAFLIPANPALDAYDAAIIADADAGLTPTAKLTSTVKLTGEGGVAFDFGVTSGDATMEFILEGDPSFNEDSFLAVGTNSYSSLRYEAWSETGALGFTQGGVDDYQFTPGVPSPTNATHVTYAWNAAASTMSVYLNGNLAGTVAGVSSSFALPAGEGLLGSNPDNAEAMLGTIYRVTVYDDLLTAEKILSHANAWRGLVNLALDSYDASVAADIENGLAPVVTLDSAVTLTGASGVPFDFGVTADDVSIEFVLEGDPVATTPSSFLAVGANSSSSLRYDQFNDTAKLGFTQATVADYRFSPDVPSPTQPTHLVYVWEAAAATLKVYVNGYLAGTATGVSPAFSMPAGAGFLGGAGANANQTMVGTIYRVVVYDDIEPEDAILRHAEAYTSVVRPPIILSFTADPSMIIGQSSATLSWEVLNSTSVSVNGTVVEEGTTELVVSPKRTSTYTLVAANTFGSVTAKLNVPVSPVLDTYDALITDDEVNDLVPVSKLTSAVILGGSAGVPFDFGTTSGEATIEFIVEGDPSASVGSYLAVGQNPDSNLRYESWGDTVQLGFTQLRVADYLFTPSALSPTWPTHVAYVWDSVTYTMKIYVNGYLAGAKDAVDPNFVMPIGAGWLGANPTGGEAMAGAIYRVTVYDDLLDEATILAHATAFMAPNNPALFAYDTAITAEAAAGSAPVARLVEPATLIGSAGVPFNFGATAGDATAEFILEGDPLANISSFLAVGQNSVSSLRYESWGDTMQLGFTQIAVADYLFTPGVPSPTAPTHVAYVWDSVATTMSIYINGVLAGKTTGVDPAFAMPNGVGRLGASLGGTEAMVGNIYRVTVYDDMLTEETILAHANTYLGVVAQPSLALDASGLQPVIMLSQGISGTHYRIEYRDSLDASDTWQLLEDIPALDGTIARVVDSTLRTTKAQRFYRAVSVP